MPIGRDWRSAKQSLAMLRVEDEGDVQCGIREGTKLTRPDPIIMILIANFYCVLRGTRHCSKSFLCCNRLAD